MYSGWQGDKVIRLFNRDSCRYEDKFVHEEIVSTGEIGFLKEKLIHNTYKSFDHYLSKIERYAEWQSKDYDKKIKKLTPLPFYYKTHIPLHQALLVSKGVFRRFCRAYHSRITKLWRPIEIRLPPTNKTGIE